jgi:membrane protease YdiL (CAAX protease family)
MSVGYMKTTYDLIISIIVLGLIPAIFEEMFFRGCLQPLLISYTKTVFAGILITSIIFSAIHFSYYGFLPRLFLSIMLGYIFYFSKNLWLNIAAHFLNNAYPLAMMYVLSSQGKASKDVLDETVHWGYGILGAVILIGLFALYKRECARVLAKNLNGKNL